MCIVGEPEDDQEELLAAVNAARSAIGVYTVLLFFLMISVRHPFGLMFITSFSFSAVGAYSGPFWKKMEPMLTFISSDNLSFLKNQVGVIFCFRCHV